MQRSTGFYSGLTFRHFPRMLQKIGSMEASAHIIVSGLVQGVGFRYFVHRRASRLGLSGIVRNLPDGSVEIEAEGDKMLLEELITHVRNGPPSAQVSDLDVTWGDPTYRYRGFTSE